MIASPAATLGIYVHLPFCPYICPYCDFAKWPLRASRAERYLRALEGEIAATPRSPAATFFLGGGTPNAYNAQAIAALAERLRDRFPSRGEEPREFTIELNPELVQPGDFLRYREAGVTRISLGVQSFVPAEIATLGRKHDAAMVESAVAQGADAGLAVSLDLIFAVPGQTPASWSQSLDTAIGLGVDHISTYGLTVEEGTPYERWQAREPEAFMGDGQEAELYALAIERLTAAGYRHYEISNFARPGFECAHNRNYWRNGEYLGLGVGAASYREGTRSTHTRSLEEYIGAIEAGLPVPGESERLDGLRRVGEAIMLALRTAQGVGLGEFKERYGIDVIDRYAPVVARFTEDGLLERTDDSLRLTERGRFLANDVCGAFVTFD